MQLITAVFALALVMLVGCQGIHFEDEVLSTAVNPKMKKRIVWPYDDALKRNLAQLAGHVIVGDLTSGSFDRGNRYVGEAGVEVVPIEAGEIFTAKCDSSAAAEGVYLMVTSSLAANEVAEVTIADISEVFIPWDDIPRDELVKEGARARDEGVGCYYVQAATLTSIVMERSVVVDSNTQGLVGEAYGAKGKVRHASKKFSRDYVVSLTLLDLSLIQPVPPNSIRGPLTLRESRVQPDGLVVIEQLSGWED
ncbi:hypothetical protein [Mucisphaera calidilacus]|uniref:Uncharacterized protein n=1 Tax=Mucisphaera calidilacus TaxID=2527982 RepID=A0A518BUP6_9BACT|nr:hypothetical protein [Mucisphaera calidilacus]QDU70654.1 hypothetical protein Pan265_04840 [Mucisphaera calidilacus]